MSIGPVTGCSPDHGEQWGWSARRLRCWRWSWSGAASAEPVLPVAAAAPRPEVSLAEDQVPDVALGAGLAELGGSFDQSDADRVVTEVVGDVLLSDRAVADGDRQLAAAVAVGPFLDDLSSRPPAAVPTRTFDSALVDVVRDPEDFQAQPRLAVTLTGTLDGAPWTSTYHVLATTADARIEREVPSG